MTVCSSVAHLAVLPSSRLNGSFEETVMKTLSSSFEQTFKWFLFVWLLLWVFALVDASLGLFWLRRTLSGVADSKAVIIVIGLSERVLGLGAISLYAYRGIRESGLFGFVCMYGAIGLNAAMMSFAVRGLLFTQFISSHHSGILFDFFTLREALVLSGLCIIICTSVGLMRRAVQAH